jgi:ATP-dependent helicase HrpA
VKVLGTPAEQRLAHWRGTRRLLQLTLPSPAKAITGRLTNAQKLALTRARRTPARCSTTAPPARWTP